MPGLERTFDAVVFNWEGTAVPNGRASARAVRHRVEALSAQCVEVAVVSGRRLADVDGQLRARPTGPGRLFLALNRGSELFVVNEHGPRLLSRRTATGEEDAALDRAAELVTERLTDCGLAAALGSPRLNRRRIDLIVEPGWTDPPGSDSNELRVAVTSRLRAAGLAVSTLMALALAASREAGLTDPRITNDGTHIEIGLTDESDSVLALLHRFAERGVGPGLTLLVGDEFGAVEGVPGGDGLLLPHEAARVTAVSVGVEPEGTPARVVHRPGGPSAFVRLLNEQLCRRRTRRVPAVDEDPAWTLTFADSASLNARARESLLTLGDGVVGIRGSHEEANPYEAPLVLIDGVYAGEGSAEHLAIGPSPLSLTVGASDASERRVLDLRSGVLMREQAGAGGVRTLRFVAASRRGVIAIRAEGPARGIAAGPLLHQPTDPPMTTGRRGSVSWARASSEHGGIAVAAAESVSRVADRRMIERFAAYTADPHRAPRASRAVAVLDRNRRIGFDRLLAEHRAAWARRWADACVSIPDDPQAQLAARFALFQLWNSVAGRGEAGVGARGLTGPGYAGHVFWDADVFVLPAIASMSPGAARAMLEYRIRRLPQARARARARGLGGARFPWESASSGDDVTPTSGWANGVPVPIRTGELEEHIGADVAWAASHYADWTGDSAFLTGPGRPLVTETARYWASRCCTEPDGRAHIRHVIGPDEYHEDVDDNAYTNMLARWNLRRAAALEGPSAETAGWLRLADALVDGYDPGTRRHEQFAGYYELEPLLVADVGTPPLAADVLLGAARVTGAQIIKQPDVLMAHHLLPDEMPQGSLGADVEYYLPRTAHGSSLSPAITASLLARTGMPDEALKHLDIALRLDLDDLTGTTDAGLHLATLGGVWQALLFGFAGVRLRHGVLIVDPRLPERWGSLQLRFRCRRRRVVLRITRESTELFVNGPLCVGAVGGGDAVRVTDHVCFDKTDSGWLVRR